MTEIEVRRSEILWVDSAIVVNVVLESFEHALELVFGRPQSIISQNEAFGDLRNHILIHLLYFLFLLDFSHFYLFKLLLVNNFDILLLI